MRQPLPRAVSLARELMAVAHEGEDHARLAVAYRALAFSLNMTGEFSEANALFVEGARLADRVSDFEFSAYGEHPAMLCRVYGGTTRCCLGFPEQGVRLVEAAVAHARARHSPQDLAWALGNLGLIRILLRDPLEAEKFSRECVELASEHRLPQWLSFGQAFLGKALCSHGDPQAGIRLQEEGMGRLLASGSMAATTRLRIWLAESLIGVGELQRARTQLEAAQAHRETYGEAYLAAEADRLEAELLGVEGAPRHIVANQLSKAIDTARSQGARFFELRAATSLARLWRDDGRRAEANTLLAPIYGRFTEGFAMPDLREAKTLLDELG
jgi:hypothetical protein